MPDDYQPVPLTRTRTVRVTYRHVGRMPPLKYPLEDSSMPDDLEHDPIMQMTRPLDLDAIREKNDLARECVKDPNCPGPFLAPLVGYVDALLAELDALRQRAEELEEELNALPRRAKAGFADLIRRCAAIAEQHGANAAVRIRELEAQILGGQSMTDHPKLLEDVWQWLASAPDDPSPQRARLMERLAAALGGK